MRSFWGFIIKEFYHIIRDKRTLVVLFGMPIIQLILFGYAIRNEINDAKIGFLDLSKDETTKKLIDKTMSSDYFKLGAILNSESEVEEAFKSGKVNIVLEFEPNFEQKAYKDGSAQVLVIADASDPNAARSLEKYAESILVDFQSSISKTYQNAGFSINPTFKMLYNPELKSVYGFVPGLIGFILMLISALMTSISITKEKEIGTMETLLVSPLKPMVIIVGKVFPYVVLAFLDAMAILGIAKWMFEAPFLGSFPLFIGEVLLFIITSLSLGILISTITSSQQTALMIALAGLMMPTMLLSGFIFPISSMPYPLQLLTHLMPAKWFLIIVKSIMLKGLGIEYFWKETLILVAMTASFILISIKKFKIRLD